MPSELLSGVNLIATNIQNQSWFQLNKMDNSDVIFGSDIIVGGEVIVGGNLHNARGAKVNVTQGGKLQVMKDTLNEGDIKIGNDQLKSLLIECIRTTGNVAEFGTKVLKKLFDTN